MSFAFSCVFLRSMVLHQSSAVLGTERRGGWVPWRIGPSSSSIRMGPSHPGVTVSSHHRASPYPSPTRYPTRFPLGCVINPQASSIPGPTGRCKATPPSSDYLYLLPDGANRCKIDPSASKENAANCSQPLDFASPQARIESFNSTFNTSQRGRNGFDGGKEAQVACRGPDCSLNGQGLNTNADDYAYAAAA